MSEHATMSDGTVLRERTAGSLGLTEGCRDDSSRWTPMRIRSEYLRGWDGDLISQAAEAYRVAANEAIARTFVDAALQSWRSMTAAEQEAERLRYVEQRERLLREAREHRLREEHQARVRHEAVRVRVEDSTLLAVVEMHAPSDDDVDECSGCPLHCDRDGYDTRADWPCDTFLLIEASSS